MNSRDRNGLLGSTAHGNRDLPENLESGKSQRKFSKALSTDCQQIINAELFGSNELRVHLVEGRGSSGASFKVKLPIGDGAAVHQRRKVNQ